MTHYYGFCKRSEHLKNVLKLIDFEGNGGRDPVSEINTLTWRCHVVVRTLATLDAGPWASRSVCASSPPSPSAPHVSPGLPLAAPAAASAM